MYKSKYSINFNSEQIFQSAKLKFFLHNIILIEGLYMNPKMHHQPGMIEDVQPKFET